MSNQWDSWKYLNVEARKGFHLTKDKFLEEEHYRALVHLALQRPFPIDGRAIVLTIHQDYVEPGSASRIKPDVHANFGPIVVTLLEAKWRKSSDANILDPAGVCPDCLGRGFTAPAVPVTIQPGDVGPTAPMTPCHCQREKA